jgi:hypothetical protein
MERAGRIAFATLNEDSPTFNPAPFIRAVLFSVAERVHYRTFASSREPAFVL